MDSMINWGGVIAHFGVPTEDGLKRKLELSGRHAVEHFSLLPVPVYIRDAQEARAGLTEVGEVTGVAIVHRDEIDMLEAGGIIDFDRLRELRPTLIDSSDPWPVGITVREHEIAERSDHVVIWGPWKLADLVIEDGPAAWPGVGIRPLKVSA